jgi:pimeloyl-ACP methyl ester carboxylesterase
MSQDGKDEWVEVNGVRLHYQDWGRREGPVILMLHGLTQQSHTFDHVAARLAARFRCLALDVRGRGRSDWAPAETYGIPQYVDDVAKLLAVLRLPEVHVLGTSMGGLIGLTLAGVAPNAVSSLALNDIGPEIDPRGAERIAAYTGLVPERFPTLDAAVDWAIERYLWLRGSPRETVTASLRWALVEEGAGWRFRFDPAIGRVPRPAPEAMAVAAQLWWKAWQSLPRPLLLVRGAESDVLGAATADRMLALRPDAIRVEVPGMGHAPTLDEPVAVAALDRFYAPA